MKFKRIISSLLVCLSLTSIMPQQANAMSAGFFSIGGTGVDWTCGSKDWPCFTITMLDETFEKSIKAADKSIEPSTAVTNYKQQFLDQYKKKLPDAKYTSDLARGRLYIMPTWLAGSNTNVSEVNDVVRYNYSTGFQEYIGDAASNQVMFKLGSPVYNMPPAIDRIREKTYKYLKDNNNQKGKLAGIWDSEETTGYMSYEEAYSALCWIFQSDSGIEDRMGEILYDNWYADKPDLALADDGLMYQTAAMLTMGIILYAAATYTPDEKAYYNTRIDEYLESFQSFEKPFVFEIEPASVWIKLNGDMFLMNCVDFLDLYMGVPEDCSVRESTWTPDNDWNIYKLLEQASNFVMWKYPGRHVLPDYDQQQFYYKQGAKQNMWTYGESLPTGIFLELAGGTVVSSKGTEPGYITNIKFEQDMYGFFLAFNPATTLIPKVTGGQDLKAEGKLLTTVDQSKTVIGEDPILILSGSFTEIEKKAWEDKYSSTKPNFIISAEIKKTGPSTIIEGTTLLTNDANNLNTRMSYEELIQFTTGELTFTFKDNLASTLIANDQTIDNKYTSMVWIKEDNPTVEWGPPLEARLGVAEKIYKRDPVAPYYISSGVTYSEIKNNEPEKEKFEAMAGTPTTEQLYFATGGSEFIVDVEMKYIADQTATRNYTDKFTSVKCADYEAPTYDDDGNVEDPGHPHTIPASSTSWTQSINFDYMQIVKCQVWKIETSKVDGMKKITGAADTITAQIKQGNPTAFWNVAKTNNAQGGRLLYSLLPGQLDNVTWTQASNNDHSGYTAANLAVTNQHKALTNQVTVVSDFLVLQTNAGDQSVMYFDEKSDVARTDTNFTFVKTSEDAMWKNNNKASSTWGDDHIAVSSYNSKYKSPDSKYKTIGSGSTVTTAFESASYGQVMSHPSRPGEQMLMYDTFDPKVTNQNGLYITGDAKTFYKHIINEGKISNVYSDKPEASTLFGGTGIVYESNYSDSHSKVNNIVLHDPVSSESAMILTLDSSRDQRTADTKPAVRVPPQDAIEYADVIPKDYMNNIVFNGNARYKNSDGLPLGWKTWSSGSGETYSITGSNVIVDDSTSWTSEHDKNWDGVQRSFYVNNTQNVSSAFYQQINVEKDKEYEVQGEVNNDTGSWIRLAYYDKDSNDIGSAPNTSISVTGSNTKKYKITGTIPNNCSFVRVIIYHSGIGSVIGDNIKMYCISNKGKFTPNDLKVEDKTSIRNPLYHSHVESGCLKSTIWECNNSPMNVSVNVLFYEYVTTGMVASNQHADDNAGAGFKGFTTNYYPNEIAVTAAINATITEKSNDTTFTGLYMKPTGNTKIRTFYTGHVHTDSCARTETYSCGLEDTSVGTASSLLNFEYTGNVQMYRTPINGTYDFTASGAQGGSSIYSSNLVGMQGGEARGSMYLNEGQLLNIYVGGYPGRTTTVTSSGWNGGGSSGTISGAGGGASDIRLGGTLSTNRIIVAGGGGGSGQENNVNPPFNGTIGGNLTSTGQSGSTDSGAGGGGYFGGLSGYTQGGYDQGGGSGSNYLNQSMSNTTNSYGVNSGNGHITITSPSKPAELKYIMGGGLSNIQPPSNLQSWEYEHVIRETKPLAAVETPDGKTYTPGNFVNVDYGFQIYFPNEGNFYDTGELGIKKTTASRGLGFEDNMDTTKWTKSKYVTFDFDTVYNNRMYRSGTRVWLDVAEDRFDFYCPLEASESLQSNVRFVAIGINNNNNALDNDQTTNKRRLGSKLKAKHSSIKTFYVDVVGRIGNMSIQDTGDFRFANFFKKSYENGEWLIPNIVPTVDISSQNLIVGDKVDIRKEPVSDSTNYLDTYGTEPYKNQEPKAFPLSPVYNNIQALRRQPLRIGYPTFMDMDTIGSYMSAKVDVLPYYYALDIDTGNIEPVDMYMSVNGSYKLINKFNKLTSGEIDETNIYNNKVYLNWTDEYLRRNYSGVQNNLSENVADYFMDSYTMADVPGYLGDPASKVEPPYGKYYVMGNNNALALTTRNRSFIGTSSTYGGSKNPNNTLNELDYSKQGQRWHFTLTLPSTAVAVKAGKELVSEGPLKTIVADNKHVILSSVDMKAMGSVYALKNSVNNNNAIEIQTIDSDGNVNTKPYDVSSIPYQVVSVNSSEKTARDDMTTSGTH